MDNSRECSRVGIDKKVVMIMDHDNIGIVLAECEMNGRIFRTKFIRVVQTKNFADKKHTEILSPIPLICYHAFISITTCCVQEKIF